MFLGGAASTPIPLIKAMTEHGKKNKLSNVTVCHIHTEGSADYAAPECEGILLNRTLVRYAELSPKACSSSLVLKLVKSIEKVPCTALIRAVAT